MTEIFKVKNGLSSQLMKHILEFIEKPYTLRPTLHFSSRKFRTTKYGIETPSYLGPKLYKTINSLSDFKAKIKILVPRGQFLKVMQNIYSPNTFYVSFPHDHF